MTKNEKQIENPKTPYSRPQLIVYGDIREITLTNKEGKAPDKPGQQQYRTGYVRPTPRRDQQ